MCIDKMGSNIINLEKYEFILALNKSRNLPNIQAINSMNIVIGLCHDNRIDIDTFSESVESSSKLS